MERSVLVLLDFSKAYDMVWQEKLLVDMIEKGVPMQYVHWLRGFLLNRQANVRFCEATSKTYKMRQGLPQAPQLRLRLSSGVGAARNRAVPVGLLPEPASLFPTA